MDALDDRKYPRTSLTDPGYSSGEEEDLSLRSGEYVGGAGGVVYKLCMLNCVCDS